MSKKSSKLDLLVRVRFENPIPDPPFPPKLLNVSTDIGRLGEPSYLDQLAASAQLPMLVDSEMGMPIDLNAFEGVWDGTEAALNPPEGDVARLEPEDAALLTPLRILGQGANGAPGASGNPIKPEVSWMRNASYMQRKETGRRRTAGAETPKNEEVDASEAAQIMAIGKTFEDVHATPLEDIRHPDAKRKHLRVVETYDILPDVDAWANSYILFKYPERPSAATAANPTATASRPRLDRAVLRPMLEDDQQLIDFFLPKDADLPRLSALEDTPIDEGKVDKVRTLTADDDKIDETFPNVPYDRIRTYEVVSQIQPEKEVLLTFSEEIPAGEEPPEEEEDMFGDEAPPRKRRKGAYFKPIMMRSQLRKTRANRRDEVDRSNLWDRLRVAFRDPAEDEVQLRTEALRSVTDPMWVNDHGGVAVNHAENVPELEAQDYDSN